MTTNGDRMEEQGDEAYRYVARQCRGLDGIDRDALAIRIMGASDNADAMAELFARTAAAMVIDHPSYERAAARALAEQMRDLAPPTFFEALELMYEHRSGRAAPLIGDSILAAVTKIGKDRIESWFQHERDAMISYTGLVVLRHSYLTVSSQGRLLETPQYMWMRVALGIHGNNPNDVRATYEMMSRLEAVHATPTLINAGRTMPQMASCFLATVADDSIEGIYDTLRQCARVSQRGGGLGVSWSHVRARGSYVAGCNGRSNGLVAWHRQYDIMVQEVDQGGGKRRGAMASYLEPWHADFEAWLDLKLPHGDDRLRARHLFYGCWVPDLLMQRAVAGADWSFFCPSEAPGLCDVWGQAFQDLYERYEKEGLARYSAPARALLQTIAERQLETGGPYMLYKDAANRKSNHQHLGTIRGSNLCVSGDTLVLTSRGHIPIRNLAGYRVTIWNGREWSEHVPVFLTGRHKNLLRVDLSNGATIDCTPEHRFHIQRRYGSKPSPKIVQAKDLVIGNKLVKWTLPCGMPAPRLVTITGVKEGLLDQDTYCLTEPKRHTALFNGILTGQCTEILEYSSADEMAVCNLASVALPSFWYQGVFDHHALARVVKQLVRNLNRVIDANHYPVEQGRASNLRHRPIGIGVQGFADLLAAAGLAWSDEGAKRLNRDVFETIYHAALSASCDLAAADGHYQTWKGSPASKGQLQIDMWEEAGMPVSGRWNWTELRTHIAHWGLRNSLLVAPMPTASTSKILGWSPSIEPYHSHVYVDRALSGDAIRVTRPLVEALLERDLWTPEVRREIIEQEGILRDCVLVPDDIKRRFQTGWEIALKDQADMVADRGPFVDQSQSFNVWLENPDADALVRFHIYGWRRGLKTGSYYIHTRMPYGGQRFALDGEKSSHDACLNSAACDSCSA